MIKPTDNFTDAEGNIATQTHRKTEKILTVADPELEQ